MHVQKKIITCKQEATGASHDAMTGQQSSC
jgi:hypothetical protein